MTLNFSLIENFGSNEADSDSLLIECFEDHPAYQQITSFKRFLVLGRKGAGKTAIFKKILTDKLPNRFVFGHTFSDYPWHAHDAQKITNVPEEERFLHSWKYLCLITVAKILLNSDHSQPFNDDSQEALLILEKFIVDSYGSRDPDVSQIFGSTKKLRFTGDVGLNWSIFKAGVKVDSVDISELPLVIQDVNRNIERAIITALNPDLEYFIMFDQLDYTFDKSNNVYSQRLTGLIRAAKDIFLKARDAGKKLNIAVFLRDDIYDFLLFEDKNKITENLSTSVIWDIGTPCRTLKSMMEKRFSYAFGMNVKWDDVFSSTRMSGKQEKYNYLLDRTFLRPRDMIKFCNEILLQVKGNSQIVENSHITLSEQNYSDYFLREIEDEIYKHMPDFRDVFEVIKGLESLQFDRDEFDSVWQTKMNSGDPIKYLARLFEFSIIGFYSTGGTSGGSEYNWKHKDNRIRFDEKAQRFCVHPGFKSAFGLKKYTRS